MNYQGKDISFRDISPKDTGLLVGNVQQDLSEYEFTSLATERTQTEDTSYELLGLAVASLGLCLFFSVVLVRVCIKK